MIKKLVKNHFFLLLLIILSSAFLYRSAFSAYFFQDDWFGLTISKVESFKDVLTFFIPRTDVIYYRPLGMQFPFFILNSLFGLNQFYFHLAVFITHSFNIMLVYYLTNKIVQKRAASLLAAFFYATSSAHFIPFYWLSTYAFVSGPTFFLLTLIFYLKSENAVNKKYYLGSILLFLTGVMVNEMVSILPLIITVFLIYDKKQKNMLILLPFYAIVLALFTLRFFFFPPPAKGLYSLGLGEHLMSNYKTYLLWSFNWSEILTEQMINFFTYTTAVSNHFIAEVKATSFLFIINVLTMVVLPTIFYLKKKLKLPRASARGFFKCALSGAEIRPKPRFNRGEGGLNFRHGTLFILWFVIGLFPVVIFSSHKFPYYLPISIIGLFIAISDLVIGGFQSIKLNKNLRLVVLFLLLTSYYLSSVITVKFNTSQHWAPRRAKISENLVKQALNSKIIDHKIYIADSSENRLALNDQSAFKLIFGPAVRTIYGDFQE